MNTNATEKIISVLSNKRTRISVTEENCTVNIFVLEKIMVRYAIKEGRITMSLTNTEPNSSENQALFEFLDENKEMLIYTAEVFWNAYNYRKSLYY